MFSSSPAGTPMWYSGTDAWSREARRVLCLAASRRLELDGELLALSDVRDLQALRLRLERGAGQPVERRWPRLMRTLD